MIEIEQESLEEEGADLLVPRRIWRSELFYVVDRWVARLLKALQAIHQGFWLGLLDREALHRLAEIQYLAWEQYQSQDYNLSGLWWWEEAALDRYFSECRSVLLGAAGGGREIVGLSRRGIQVDAFEPCPGLVESCQEFLTSEGIAARAILSPPDRVPDQFGTYDGLIMGWGGYMHIAGRQTRIQFLKQFRRHVRAGGPILLSFFTRGGESQQLSWIFKIAQFIRPLFRNDEAVELGDTLFGTFDHYFTQEEIKRELEASGFQLEYYSEKPYGHAVGRAV